MVYFDQILHTNACFFLMDEGLLSIISAGCGQLVKIPITFEPHGIFGSKCAYLFTYFNICAKWRHGLSMSKFQIIGKHWKRSETSSTPVRCMREQQML